MVTWPRCPWLFQTRKFRRFGFRCVLWLNDTSIAKASVEVNRKCPPRNMTVQPSTSYTDPDCHNPLHHRQTDRQTDGLRTDRQQYHANSRSYCVQQYDRLKTTGCQFLAHLVLGLNTEATKTLVNDRPTLANLTCFHGVCLPLDKEVVALANS